MINIDKNLDKKKAVIYVRGNVDDVYEQYLSCKQYADKNNMEIVEVYNDKTSSGVDKNRIYFNTMLEKSKEYDFVLVSFLKNLTRSYETYQIVMNTLLKNNTKLVVVNENDVSEEVLIKVNEILNTLHSTNISKTLGDSIIENRKHLTLNHIFAGGIIPYGYMRDKNNKIHIVEDEAKIVKIIYQMYAEGKYMIDISKYLLDKGYKRQNGKDFNLDFLKRTLKNEVYYGKYIYNKYKREKADGMQKRVLNDEKEWAVSDKIFPPIIDKELFDKAQEKRKFKNSFNL